MAEGVEITDNTGAYLNALKLGKLKALETIGAKWADYARGIVDTRRWGDQLSESITHLVDEDEGKVYVGSNMQIAPYAELGTGREYVPPPEYIGPGDDWQKKYGPGGSENKGKARAGIDHWYYFDEVESRRQGRNVFGVGTPQPPSPYLRPAYEQHRDEYEEIIKRNLQNAGN